MIYKDRRGMIMITAWKTLFSARGNQRIDIYTTVRDVILTIRRVVYTSGKKLENARAQSVHIMIRFH
jgi:hypothetical protein